MGHGSSQTVPYGDPITVKTPPSLLCLFLSSDSGSELILTQIFSRALRLYIMVSRADQQTEHTRTGSCAQTIVLPTLRSEPTQNFDYFGSGGKWLRKTCQSLKSRVSEDVIGISPEDPFTCIPIQVVVQLLVALIWHGGGPLGVSG